MAINAMELAEYLQSQAQGCKDLSTALMVAMGVDGSTTLHAAASRAANFLDELETALVHMSDELYTEGWE